MRPPRRRAKFKEKRALCLNRIKNIQKVSPLNKSVMRNKKKRAYENSLYNKEATPST